MSLLRPRDFSIEPTALVSPRWRSSRREAFSAIAVKWLELTGAMRSKSSFEIEKRMQSVTCMDGGCIHVRLCKTV